jgi:rhodanese-related sulfurtransferase
MTRDRSMSEWFWWLPLGKVPEISAVELHERLLGGTRVQLLDVRSHGEWHRSRIAEATNVPITHLRRQIATLGLDGTRPVVAICLSAHRSIPAVRLLRARGFQEVMQLKGGMLAWWRDGLPTVGGDADSVKRR